MSQLPKKRRLSSIGGHNLSADRPNDFSTPRVAGGGGGGGGCVWNIFF